MNGAARGLVFGCLAVAAATGCVVQGPVEVEALVADGQGSMERGVTTLQTVTDLYAGTGSEFDVVGGLMLTFDFVFTTMTTGDYTYPQMVEEGRRGARNALNLRLSANPLTGVYESEDFDTFLYLTVFSNVEKAWAFFRDDLGDDSGATQDHGLVGLYGSQVLSSLLPVPITPGNDNAAYVSIGDVFYTLRVHDQEGIPLAMSQGVIAHEFGHRIFFHNVIVDNAFEAWKTIFANVEVDQQNPQAATQQNSRGQIIMRGLDEGLADVFAVSMVGTGHFTEDSFIDSASSLTGGWSDQAAFRDLEGDFATFVTFEQMQDDVDNDLPFQCGRIPAVGEEIDGLANEVFNPYCLGVLLARTVYEAAGRSPEVMRRDFAPRILPALQETGRRVAAESAAQEVFKFEPEYLLDAIAQQLAADDRASFCAVVKDRFSSLTSAGVIPTCP